MSDATTKRIGRPRADRCARGHNRTLPGSTYADGSCKMCRKIWHAAQAERTTPKRTMQQDREDITRTRKLLAVADALNRNPMPWEREQLEAEYQQLLRGSA